MDTAFLQDRITNTKATIVAYEDAETALIAGTMQSYTFDSGQTRQTVTLLNVTELRRAIDSLYNRLATLEARLNGSGAVIVGPRF